MIGAVVVMPALIVALGAMTLAVRRLGCGACGCCTRCTGLSVSQMIAAREAGQRAAERLHR